MFISNHFELQAFAHEAQGKLTEHSCVKSTAVVTGGAGLRSTGALRHTSF
jgi:hypothetical protein